ncbi:unnamed protein product [Lactuca saligna]|uniref:Adaptor protein ClpS core domain-containing protein n=1 Tax=Lactuca saligna TaxID=75948 RepID=A0AA35Z5G4_LACSI|nr:unnamed protein product [Lactuca saligna]
MKPLSNISLSNIGFSLHSRLDYLNATVCFSLAARSYNDKLEAWEPLVEPVDGVLRCSPKYPCLYTKNCILGSTYLLIWDLQSISSIYVPVEAYLYFVDNGIFSVDGVLFDNPVTPSAAFMFPLLVSITSLICEVCVYFLALPLSKKKTQPHRLQSPNDIGGTQTSQTKRNIATIAGVPFVDVVTTMLGPTIPLTTAEWENCYFALRNNCHQRIILPYTGDKYLLHKQSTKWITVMTMAPPRLENGAGVLDKPVIEKTTPGRESEFDLRKSRKMAPPYRVMLHNDNYNKREYVVQVLMKVIPGMTLTRIGRDAVLYVESLVESIMGGFEELINILGSEGASTRSQLKLQMAFDGRERYMKRSWEPSDKADLHFVYKDVEGVSTQWDDIQRKLRNLPPKPSAFKPDPFTPAEDEDSKPKTKSRIDKKTEELKDLEDDLDDSCFLKEYKKRLAEMKQTVEV